MAAYQITFARSASRELETLDALLIARILDKIEILTEIPRPSGARKLQGERNLWRIRVGDYRIIYSINDEKQIVDITRIRHRNKVYK